MRVRQGAAIALLFPLLATGWALASHSPRTTTPSPTFAVPASWPIVDHGTRGGVVYEVPIGGSRERSAVYLPAPAGHGRRLRLVILIPDSGFTASRLSRGLAIARVADQLTWDGSAPPFVLLVPARGTSVHAAIAFANAHLPVLHGAAARVLGGVGDASGETLSQGMANPALARTLISLGDRSSGRSRLLARPASVVARREIARLQRDHTRIVIGVAYGDRTASSRARAFERALDSLGVGNRVFSSPGLPGPAIWHQLLFRTLAYALTPTRAHVAAAQAREVLPRDWSEILAGPSGGTVWQGVIPNQALPSARRVSLIYLPPSFDRSRRYPVMYLLHGLPGSPYSFIGGVRFAATADRLIAAKRIRPFIGVMPPAGETIAFNGEWTGVWERFVLHDVVHFVDSHLSTSRSAAGRTIAGLSAGGFGAVNIGLRHPKMFGTLESWSGSFSAPRDGSLATATSAQRAANDPNLRVRLESARLHAQGTRIFLSAGLEDREALSQTRQFADLLTKLGLPHRTSLAPGGHRGSFWRASLAGALSYAFAVSG